VRDFEYLNNANILNDNVWGTYDDGNENAVTLRVYPRWVGPGHAARSRSFNSAAHSGCACLAAQMSKTCNQWRKTCTRPP
jgi:hypothetical protein